MVIFLALFISIICFTVLKSFHFSHRMNLGFYFILSISIISSLSEWLDHLFLIILFLTLLGGILMLLMFLSSYTSDSKLMQTPTYISMFIGGVFMLDFLVEDVELESASCINFSSDLELLGVEVLLILSFLTVLMLIVFVWLA